MSAIYFHSQDGEAAVRGSERAYMGVLCSDLMLGVIGDFDLAKALPIIVPDSYLHRMRDVDLRSIRTYLGGSSDGAFIIDAERIAAWDVSLNTVMHIGNDTMKLMARLHGQCEVHCWVVGKNRKWLARLIRDGRESDILRENQGWEKTADFLEANATLPVVCSYSVCERFPNFDNLPWKHPLKRRDDDERFDEFHEIDTAEQWRLCMNGLRAREREGWSLELKPETFGTVRFGKQITAFDVARAISKIPQSAAA